jgi:hypothetical protein
MDDGSDRATPSSFVIPAKAGIQNAKKTLVIMASLLVLFGAGCAKTQEEMVALNAPGAQLSTEESGVTPGLCYSSATPLPASFPETGIVNTMGHFRPASDTEAFDQETEELLPQLKGLYDSGWNIRDFCVIKVDGERAAYFSLYAFYGDALSSQLAEVLTDGNEKSQTFVRFGYAKNNFIVLSDPIALGNNEGEDINLPYKLSYNFDTDIIIKARASTHNWTYDISFDPIAQNFHLPSSLEIKKLESK